MEQLDEEDAAEVLAYARWLLAEEQILTLEDLPAVWRRTDEPAGESEALHER